jgi:uncharacterized protein
MTGHHMLNAFDVSLHFLPFPPGSQSRAFSLSPIPAILLPPIVFSGLVIALWTYKSLMMIVFQSKINYMPSVPLFSRSEKVEDYAVQCRPVVWREHDLRAADGVALKLLEGMLGRRLLQPKTV